MATIRKRSGRWSVQVRRKGYESESNTFGTRAAAAQWAREREALIDRGQPTTTRQLKSQTLGDLVRRYLIEITPTKLSADTERQRLMKMLNAPLFDVSLADLSAAPIAAYRDKRASEVKPGTIGRELSLLHNVIDIARKEWGIPLSSNAVTLVRKIPIKNARDRRLRAGEFGRLQQALQACRNSLIHPAALFALETGLRRGELLNLEWKWVNLLHRTAHIPHTKTGYSRTVPLTDQAIAILKDVPSVDAKVFPLTPMALKLAWNRVRKRAGVADLRFHDLRHEAISRFAEMGFSTVELAAISGHRDLRMLTRYTHIQPLALAKKLAGRSWEREIGNL